MNRSTLRIAGVVVAVTAVTAITTAVVTAAVTNDDGTLSPADVNQLLADATTSVTTSIPATGTVPVPATSSSALGERNVATLVPGTVTVSCEGNLATLLSWSPNPGYRADDPVRGPAAEVSIRFENDSSDADYKVSAVCGSDGSPVVSIGPDDHHGGGRH